MSRTQDPAVNKIAEKRDALEDLAESDLPVSELAAALLDLEGDE